MFAAHAAPAMRFSFIPLAGSGGNAGKREFSEGCKTATETLRRMPKSGNAEQRDDGTKALLIGDAAGWTLDKLNAASWFSAATSGQSAFALATVLS